MTTKTKKDFDTVEYFRVIKEKMAKKMAGMTLTEKKEFLRKLKEGSIKLA